MALSPSIEAAIQREARRTGLDPATIRAFVMIESGGNPGVTTGSYRGLLQLSPQQFQQYGGQGDIHDADANVTAGANKLADMAGRFQSRTGRKPSAAELYMMHQQGEGGAAAHYANPDAPAWQNMAGTGEGREKGPDWAKRAIWGNVPDDVKARYGSVDNLTSRDFTKLWEEKVARLSGQPSNPSSEPQIQPVAGKLDDPATLASQPGETPVIAELAKLFGMSIPGMGGGSPLGSPAAGGSAPFSIGGGVPGGTGGGGDTQAKLAQSAMKAAEGGADPGMRALSLGAPKVDMQQLMAVLKNRQRLGA